MNDFMKTEYTECLSLLKYYDERYHSMVKFSAGLSSAVPSLLMGLYTMRDMTIDNFWPFASFVSAMTSLGLLAIFTVMIQLRLYFIYPARQVNALRRTFLSMPETTFQDNQMYLDTTFSAFKMNSTHTVLNLFVSVQVGIFAALANFGIFIQSMDKFGAIWCSAVVGLLIVIFAFGLASYYLYERSKYHPDLSVHGN